ncbi:FMN-binding split barrel-like protein [Penicillium lividum]|nr:FMN-binding split barrel-like protein [Penicillium lividum]
MPTAKDIQKALERQPLQFLGRRSFLDDPKTAGVDQCSGSVKSTYGVEEFERANFAKEPATLMGVPMVQESPVKFELAVLIKDEVLTDGILDVRKTKPLARCGYYQYTVIRETFDVVIPGMSEDVLYGLEGSAKRNKEAESRNA